MQLRFDIEASSLPESLKTKLRRYADKRISPGGIIIIKAQTHRSQNRNREAALERLAELIRTAIYVPPYRRPTKPSKNARLRRTDSKTRRGQVKRLRGKVRGNDDV